MKKEHTNFVKEFIIVSQASADDIVGIMIDAVHLNVEHEFQVAQAARKHIEKYVLKHPTGFARYSTILEEAVYAYFDDVILPFINTLYPVIRKQLTEEYDIWTIDYMDYDNWRGVTIGELMDKYSIEFLFEYEIPKE